MKQAKVFVIDDHAVVRQGLSRMLEKHGGFTICGEAADGSQALKLIKSAKPDIAIVDIGLHGMNGIELIKHLKKLIPDLPILTMSMFDESIYAERVLRAGAKGYIMKQESVENIVGAVERVLSGKIYLSEKRAESLLNGYTEGPNGHPTLSVDLLSDRELEVFRLLGQGFKNQRIAEELHLSIKTVESYREQVKAKLNLKDSTELLQYAIKWMRLQQMLNN